MAVIRMMRLAQCLTQKVSYFNLPRRKYGRDKFDDFVKTYFNEFAFKSLTTAQFVSYIKANLIEKYPGVVSMDKVNEWIFQPGLPSDAPNPTSDAFDKVDTVTASWLKGIQLPHNYPLQIGLCMSGYTF